jgi:tetratricopeptide (TPR) repeat protein
VYGETFLPRIHFNWSELRAAENAKYHFIDAPKPELYNVTSDPGETHNLLAEKKAVGEEMRAKLVALIREYSAGKELAEKTGLDPALMERLKSLGYAAFSGGSDPTISSRDLADPKDRIEAYEQFSDAMVASQHGRFEESNEKLKTVIKIEPKMVAAHYMAGLNYYRLHSYPESVAELRKAVELSPDYALAVFNLGMSQAHAGQIEEAVATLQRALELDGTNFEAAYNLGVAYLQKQDWGHAKEALRKSVTINPGLARGHRALGEILLYQGQVDEALAELQSAVQLAPQEPQMHESLAKALEAKGLTAEAEAERQRAKTGPQ